MVIQLILSVMCTVQWAMANLDIAVQATQTGLVPLEIFYIKSGEADVGSVPVNLVIKDLVFVEQFAISCKHVEALPSKSERLSLRKNGLCIAVFIIDCKDHVDLYVHDLISDQSVSSKRLKKSDSTSVIAHKISDIIMQALTGKSSFFNTQIAYCKEVAQINKRVARKQIVVAHVDGSEQQVLLQKPSMIFGLRWNSGAAKDPFLFYSEHTKFNVRLMMMSMNGKKRVASNEDGITMLPACMPDGTGVIYCATDGQGYAQLYFYTLDSAVQITNMNGNSMAPSVNQDGTVLYFCSDYPDEQPHICAYDFATKKITAITQEGYCVSPAVVPEGDKVAYIKMVKGVMQIFLYHVTTEKHLQLTFDEENKDSLSWSPCGTYLLYGASKSKGDQRIVLFNTITKKKKYITAITERCSSPSWSPIYHKVPLVKG